MLFNLAAAIQLDFEPANTAAREDSATIRQQLAVKADFSVIRDIRPLLDKASNDELIFISLMSPGSIQRLCMLLTLEYQLQREKV